MSNTKLKVLGLICCENEFLYSEHPEHKEVEFQLVSGTVEKESPEENMLRELEEETGIQRESVISIQRVGKQFFNMKPFRNEIQERMLFIIKLNNNHNFSDSWTYIEKYGGDEDILLKYHWSPLSNPVPLFIGHSFGFENFFKQYSSYKFPITAPDHIFHAINKIKEQTLRKLALHFPLSLDTKKNQTFNLCQLMKIGYCLEKEIPLDSEIIVSLLNREDFLGTTTKEKCIKVEDENHDSTVYIPLTNGFSKSDSARSQNLIRTLKEINIHEGFLSDLVEIILLENKELNDKNMSYFISDIPGIIYLDNNLNDLRQMETILHESLHTHFNWLLIHYGFKQSNKLFYSFWRKEQRPLNAILHAVFVFSLLVQFWSKAIKELQLSSEEREYCNRQIKNNIFPIQKTVAEIDSQLTELHVELQYYFKHQVSLAINCAASCD